VRQVGHQPEVIPRRTVSKI